MAGDALRMQPSRRGLRTSASSLAAQNFTMPALSPTMTEGNIASWKVKEGESYSAGDVLLEIETDKAQMDVEAQDDGILAKIMQAEGSKGVKVGTRIAVIAEPGDDISSLDIPPEDSAQSQGQPKREDRPSPQEEMKSGIDPTESSENQAEAPPSSKPNADASAGGAADTTRAEQLQSDSSSKSSSKPGASAGKAQKQKYPLYPSVLHLLKENGLTKEDGDKIPASGPLGRLLKGDVLAYLGKIDKSYSAEQSKRIEKMGHLDLSNIKVSTPKKAEPAATDKKTAAAPELPLPEPDLEVAIPISLTAVLACQQRIQSTLGIHLPLSTFIARASELANDALPRSKTAKPSANELFNAVLGLDKVSTATSRGHFIPQIVALPPSLPTASAARIGLRRQPDVYDILSGKAPARKRAAPRASAMVQAAEAGVAAGEATVNVFSLSVPKGEEARARVFLERVKLVLEGEPGRLVL